MWCYSLIVSIWIGFQKPAIRNWYGAYPIWRHWIIPFNAVALGADYENEYFIQAESMPISQN